MTGSNEGRPRLARSERGFATIELLTASFFVTIVISGGLTIAYVAFARVWIDRNSYEASVCLATDAERSRCEKDFRRAVETALPIGKVESLFLERGERSVSVRGRWRAIEALPLDFDDRRRLPLRGSP